MLTSDGVYEPIEPDRRGWFWSGVLGVYIGRWNGRYDQEDERWIRLYDSEGRLIPTEAERENQLKKQAEERAESERRFREQAEERAESERRFREQAEERAEEEGRLKEKAEERLAGVEAEIARLKQLLESEGSSDNA